MSLLGLGVVCASVLCGLIGLTRAGGAGIPCPEISEEIDASDVANYTGCTSAGEVVLVSVNCKWGVLVVTVITSRTHNAVLEHLRLSVRPLPLADAHVCMRHLQGLRSSAD